MLAKLKAAQFVRFCIVGGISTSVSYIVFGLFFLVLDTYYIVAGALGFLLSVFPGFYLNRKWTFQSNAPVKASLFNYFLVAFLVLGAHSGTQWFVVEILLVDEIWSQLFGIAVTTLLNFTISRRYVFTRH
jgi:putative flippase GtrA